MQWIENVCRICGELHETYHLIFNKESENDIINKIRKCLKLELFKDDYKPKQLCNICLIKLNDFSQFIDICQATDEKFETILLNRHEWPNNNQNTNILDYTQHKISSVIVGPSNELDLYKESSILPLETINEHEMLQQIVEDANYVSADSIEYLNPNYNPIIKKYSDTNEFYPTTTVLRHSSHYQENSCSSSIAINYSCHEIEQEKSLKSTSNDYYDLNYAPTTTNNIGLDYSNYNSRNDCINSSEKIKIISIEKFGTNSTTTNSINKPLTIIKKQPTKPTRLFECPHCNKQFKRRVTLNSHIAVIHTKIRPYICDICKKSYAVKCDLTAHQKIHTDLNKCKYCSNTFTSPSKLQRHLRIHTKDRPFVCKSCGKSFSDKRNLIGHEIVHTNLLNFQCKKCNKKFKSQHSLKQHEKSHLTDFVPFVCEICSKSYKYKSNLIIHLKKHNGYYCPYCQKDCERIVKLLKHKKECRLKQQII